MTGSGSSVEMRAVPPMVKVRAVGSVKLRLMAGSGSVRGGTAGARSRLSRITSSWDSDAAPALANRSVGSRSVWMTGATPGIVTSANPTPE